MSCLIPRIRILIKTGNGFLFQKTNYFSINIGYRTARIVVSRPVRDSLVKQRNLTVCLHQHKIGKSLLEIHLTQTVSLYLFVGTRDCIDIFDSHISAINQVIATFPNGVGHIISLIIAGTCVAECPVRTGSIVTVHIKHAGEIPPTEHIVRPFTVHAGHPLADCSIIVAHLFRAHKRIWLFAQEILASGESCHAC